MSRQTHLFDSRQDVVNRHKSYFCELVFIHTTFHVQMHHATILGKNCSVGLDLSSTWNAVQMHR